MEIAFLRQILTISTSACNFLTMKEHTCILILTKDALSEVGRLLVKDSPCVGRSILKDQRR